MSDRIRTALEGGGSINISINIDASGLVQLCVTESWARLTGIQHSEIKARTLDAADDPDKFIADELAHLFNKHMNWKVAAPAEEQEEAVEVVLDPVQDAITEMMHSSPYIPAKVFRDEPIPILGERPKPSPAVELIKSIQNGTYISLRPAPYQKGETQGVQVVVEGINPRFSAMRRLNQTVTGVQMDAAEDPTALVWQRVYDMVCGLSGPC